MSASTVTMEELELESGLLNVSALNGSFDNILSLGSGNIW
jgi:hypothetical protein